ncbi:MULTISPECIES: hypothetical protein [unclassified Nocardia]|uniref:hypothetical protein n=1 Tax=unclassified Nocardia TaxID=2637762 RepID=UPI0024A929AA|nr:MULTISPECIES: hypothetical protein [unclassified Nocardia]
MVAFVSAAVCGTAGTLFPASTAHATDPAVVVHPGLAIRTMSEEDGKVVGFQCTVGLTGFVGKARYAVTAGHCRRPGVVTDADGNPIGWYESYRPDRGLTLGFGLIRLYEGVGVSASMGAFGLSSIDMDPRRGQQVCKIGASTGWNCGTITKVEDGVIYTTRDLWFEHGDSGGVVYRQTSDGHAAFVGIAMAYVNDRDREAIVEPASWLFDQIQRYGPTANEPFKWYRVH